MGLWFQTYYFITESLNFLTSIKLKVTTSYSLNNICQKFQLQLYGLKVSRCIHAIILNPHTSLLNKHLYFLTALVRIFDLQKNVILRVFTFINLLHFIVQWDTIQVFLESLRSLRSADPRSTSCSPC